MVNANRLTLPILPPPIDRKQTLRPWAANLRDNDERWQKLSQDGVQVFMGIERTDGAITAKSGILMRIDVWRIPSCSAKLLRRNKGCKEIESLFVGDMELPSRRADRSRAIGWIDLRNDEFREEDRGEYNHSVSSAFGKTKTTGPIRLGSIDGDESVRKSVRQITVLSREETP